MKNKYGFIFSLLFAFAILFSLKTVPAYASIADEAQQIDISNPEGITLNSGLNDSGRQSYSFILDKEMNLSLTATTNSKYNQNFTIYNTSGEVLWKDGDNWTFNNVTELDKMHSQVNLKKGTYYLAVTNNKSNFITYNITIKPVKIISTPATPKIKTVKIGQTLKGSYNDDQKVKYKFKLTKKTNIKLSGTFADAYKQDIYLYDKDGQLIWRDRYANNDWTLNNITDKYKLVKKINLKKGTYYIVLKNHSGKTLNYKLKTTTLK